MENGPAIAGDMERVNQTILARTGSDVTMIPEVANHLISSGGKRLRPMLTLATAGLCDYRADGHIKLAAAVAEEMRERGHDVAGIQGVEAWLDRSGSH